MNRQFIHILYILLLTFTTASAQDSIPQPASIDEHKIGEVVSLSRDNDIQLAPWDSLHNQSRFIYKGESYPFGNDSVKHSGLQKFLSRLSLGFVTGFQTIAPRGPLTIHSSHPVGISLSYDLNRLSTLRGTAIFNRHDVEGDFDRIKQIEGDFDYLFNLSNYSYGYNPNRRFNMSAVFGVGGILSGYHGIKMNFKGQFGLNMDYRLTPGTSIFVEPYLAAATDQIDYSNNYNTHKWDLLYGAKAGITFHMFNNRMKYDNMVYNGRIFVDVSEGYVFRTNGEDLGFLSSAGNSYTLSVGKWIDPYFGVKFSGYLATYSSSKQTVKETVYSETAKAPEYDIKFRTFMIGSRAELMLNILNVLRVTSDMFEVSISAGGDYGYFWRRKDVKSRIKLDTFYSGFTTATQFVYRPDDQSALFLEPRLQLNYYNTKNANADDFTDKHTDQIWSFNLGLRMQGRSRYRAPRIFSDLEEDNGHHFFFSAHVGGNKRIAKYREVTEGLPNFQIGASFGYHIDNFSLFRLKAEYMQNSFVDERSYSVASGKSYPRSVWTSTPRLLNTELTYMFNFSNLYQGIDNSRRVNAYLYLGPSYTWVYAHNNQIFKDSQPGGYRPIWTGEKWTGRASWGLVGGAVVDFRISDKISVFVEPEAQVFFDRYFDRSVSSFPDKKGIYNKFSIGSTYRF